MRRHALPLLALAAAGLAALVSQAAPAADQPPAPPQEIVDWIAATMPAAVEPEPLTTALADAGDNWHELATGLEAVKAGAPTFDEQDLLNAVWLLEKAPHLDRLELTTVVLLDSLSNAGIAVHEHGYDRASDFFRRYVLNYRLDDEPVTAWRAELATRYEAERGNPLALAQRVSTGFTEIERGYFGNEADPLSVDNSRAGTLRELSLLVAAALRAAGYGTRFVSENRSGKSWVEVYQGDPVAYDAQAWTPVYPTAPEHNGEAAYARELCGGRITVVTAGDAFGREQVTARYSEVCGVRVHCVKDGAELPDYEHWSINAWGDGYYVPLDDLAEEVAGTNAALPAAGGDQVYYVGPGEYRAVAGLRYPGGVVHVVTQDFTAQPGPVVDLTLALDAPASLPLAALVERQAKLPEDDTLLHQGAYIYVVYDTLEPSIRAREALGQYAAFNSVQYQEWPRATEDAAQQAFIRDVLLVTDADPLPVVVVLVDGETKLYQRGYNVNIADWVARALGREP